MRQSDRWIESTQLTQCFGKWSKVANEKETEWSFTLSNHDLHRICGREDQQFHARQQKYLVYLVRQSNDTMTKRLLFNSNIACKPGRQPNLESRVLCDEFINADEFSRLREIFAFASQLVLAAQCVIQDWVKIYKSPPRLIIVPPHPFITISVEKNR